MCTVELRTTLERREEEHRRRWPKGHIKQVGRRATEEGATEWEKKKGFVRD